MGLPGQEYFAGTHFNPQITWAKQAHALVGYLNRCQFLLQQGRFVADVLYYYGNHVPNIARLKKDDPAKVLPQYDYDVINEEVLLQASVREGRVTLPSGMSYRVLVLPNLKGMSLEVARKLRELVAAGATIVGPKPDHTTGRQDDAELKRIAGELWDSGRITSRTAREAVGVPPDVEGIPDWIHRRSRRHRHLFRLQPTSPAGTPRNQFPRRRQTARTVGRRQRRAPRCRRVHAARTAARSSRWSCPRTVRCSSFSAGRQPAAARAAIPCRSRRSPNLPARGT